MVKFKGRLVLFIIAFVTVIIVGMAGFMVIEQKAGNFSTVVQAFSWTIITMTTLGSYSVNTALTSDVGEFFTAVIVLSGVVVFFFGAPLVVIPWFEAKIKNALKPKPIPLPKNGHVIICGYNETIRVVTDSLKIHGFNYIIIDTNEDVISTCQTNKIPHINGIPSNEETLKKANIHQAVSLITSQDDAANAFVCLTAKSLNEKLNIIAIVENTENTKTLLASGASRVINPKSYAGNILGVRACHDYSLDVSGKFAVFGDLEIRQYAITHASPIANVSISDNRIQSLTGAMIIGLWKDGQLHTNISPDEILSEGMTVLVMGTEKQLNSFHNIVGSN